MSTEADTCRTYVVPKLYSAGWSDDQIGEQRAFTDGRIIVSGTRAWRRPQKRADYLLHHSKHFPLAVVEAKAEHKNPLLTRHQRAERVKREEAQFFSVLSPEAREILNELLEKYADDGELQFSLPDILKLPPISQHGNVNEITQKFGGPDRLRTAVNQLQELLYSA